MARICATARDVAPNTLIVALTIVVIQDSLNRLGTKVKMSVGSAQLTVQLLTTTFKAPGALKSLNKNSAQSATVAVALSWH